MLLTDESVIELATIAEQYAISRNLDVNCYLAGLLNPETLGNSDAYIVVEILKRYHKEWLLKS